MREKNMRLVIVGLVLAFLAVVFFLYMMGLAPKSNDPQTMLATVGQVSGAVGAIGLVMAIIGFVGKKKA